MPPKKSNTGARAFRRSNGTASRKAVAVSGSSPASAVYSRQIEGSLRMVSKKPDFPWAQYEGAGITETVEGR